MFLHLLFALRIIFRSFKMVYFLKICTSFIGQQVYKAPYTVFPAQPCMFGLLGDLPAVWRCWSIQDMKVIVVDESKKVRDRHRICFSLAMNCYWGVLSRREIGANLHYKAMIFKKISETNVNFQCALVSVSLHLCTDLHWYTRWWFNTREGKE